MLYCGLVLVSRHPASDITALYCTVHGRQWNKILCTYCTRARKHASLVCLRAGALKVATQLLCQMHLVLLIPNNSVTEVWEILCFARFFSSRSSAATILVKVGLQIGELGGPIDHFCFPISAVQYDAEPPWRQCFSSRAAAERR